MRDVITAVVECSCGGDDYCSNGGVCSRSSGCVCPHGYVGQHCETREYMTSEIHALCPHGYVGQHCETRECMTPVLISSIAQVYHQIIKQQVNEPTDVTMT